MIKEAVFKNYRPPEELETSFMQNHVRMIHSEFLVRKEKVINEALIKNGFTNLSTQFIQENFKFITSEKDQYKHLYYRHDTPDEIRIISIQKEPEMSINSHSEK